MVSLIAPSKESLQYQRQLVLALPKPRAAKMAWSQIRDYSVLLFMACFLMFMELHNIRIGEFGKHLLDNFIAPAIILLLLIIISHTFSRNKLEKWLITEGDCAVGRITSQQRVGGRHKQSRIRYKCSLDSVGEISGKGTDITFEYLVDSPVLIFYDPNKPERNVAYCSTGWRIITGDKTLLQP